MDCKVCGSSNLESLDIENKYYQCNQCELIFIDQAEIVDPDEEKERYEGHDNNHQNQGYVEMFEDFIDKLIEPHLDLGEIKNVLEFGSCSTTYTALFLDPGIFLAVIVTLPFDQVAVGELSKQVAVVVRSISSFLRLASVAFE